MQQPPGERPKCVLMVTSSRRQVTRLGRKGGRKEWRKGGRKEWRKGERMGGRNRERKRRRKEGKVKDDAR